MFCLAFDAELICGGRAIFENKWEGALLFSTGQITPQCHSEQFRHYNHHGYSKIVEIVLVAAEPTRNWRHTVKICLQPKQMDMLYNFSNRSKIYRFLLKFTFYLF